MSPYPRVDVAIVTALYEELELVLDLMAGRTIGWSTRWMV